MDRINPIIQTRGFTLVELMIVIAIMGVLASFAIPAYQDYTKRSHVAEGLSLAQGVKGSVVEYYASEGNWPADNAAAGLASATDLAGGAVKSIEVNAYVIRVNFNAKVKDDAQLILLARTTGSGKITWECRSTTDTTNFVPTEYLPANCQ